MGIWGKKPDDSGAAHRAEDTPDGLSTAERKVKAKLRDITKDPNTAVAKKGAHRSEGDKK
jgi:hypothetical protein